MKRLGLILVFASTLLLNCQKETNDIVRPLENRDFKLNVGEQALFNKESDSYNVKLTYISECLVQATTYGTSYINVEINTTPYILDISKCNFQIDKAIDSVALSNGKYLVLKKVEYIDSRNSIFAQGESATFIFR